MAVTSGQYLIHSDSDGSRHEMVLRLNGFKESWAYATATEDNGSWEFDLCAERLDHVRHFSIPYTCGHDLLETLVTRCVAEYLKDFGVSA